MNRHIMGWIVCIFLYSSCIETDIDYTFPYTEKPITLGFLDSIWGIRVWSGKTNNILEKDTSILENSKITLYDKSGFIASLTHQGRNVFTTMKSFQPIHNNEYLIKSANDKFAFELTSDFASIPATIPILQLKYRKLNNSVSGIDLFIEFKDPLGFNAYGYFIQRFKNDTAMNEDYRFDSLYVPFYPGLQNDRAFNNTKHTLRIENYPLETNIDRNNVIADSLKVTLFNVSRAMYDLFLSLNTPEPGSGDSFFDPTVISNSSKDGIIVLGAYSHASKGIRIK